MRILHLNYEFPPLGGGAGRASAELLENMARLGHECLVLTTRGKDTPVESEPLAGLQIIRLPSLRRRQFSCSPHEMLSYLNQAQRFLPRLKQRFKPDIVLSFFGFPSGFAGAKAARLFNCPHVIGLRGMDVPGFDHDNLKLYHAFLGPFILKLWQRSDCLIANSQSLKMKALVYAKKNSLPPVEVIGNGLDGEFLQRAQIMKRSEGPLKILFAGRFAKQKGLTTLIQALSEPNILRESWQLDVVGDGPMRGKLLRMLANSPVRSRIRLHGWLSPSMLKSFYENAHMLLLPSEDEGMSNVLIEAMAHGLVVVACAAGGNSEMLEHKKNGILALQRRGAPKDNVQNFRLAILEAMQIWRTRPEEFRSLGRAAQMAVSDLSWESQAKKFLARFEKLIARRNESNLVPLHVGPLVSRKSREA